MVSGGSQSSSSKPYFINFGKNRGQDTQLGAATRAFEEILMPRIFGGSPDVGTEAAINRGRSQLGADFASRGLRGSGLEARAMAEQGARATLGREAAFMQQVMSLIAPLGQASGSSGFNFGFKP